MSLIKRYSTHKTITMTTQLTFDFYSIRPDLRIVLYQIIFDSNVDLETDTSNHKSDFGHLLYLAWLYKHELIHEVTDGAGWIAWEVEEGYVFDPWWFYCLNEFHIGLNIEATRDYYGLEEIMELLP